MTAVSNNTNFNSNPTNTTIKTINIGNTIKSNYNSDITNDTGNTNQRLSNPIHDYHSNQNTASVTMKGMTKNNSAAIKDIKDNNTNTVGNNTNLLGVFTTDKNTGRKRSKVKSNTSKEGQDLKSQVNLQMQNKNPVITAKNTSLVNNNKTNPSEKEQKLKSKPKNSNASTNIPNNPSSKGKNEDNASAISTVEELSPSPQTRKNINQNRSNLHLSSQNSEDNFTELNFTSAMEKHERRYREPNYLRLIRKKSSTEFYRRVTDREKEKIEKELTMESHILNSILNFKQLLSKDSSHTVIQSAYNNKESRHRLDSLQKEITEISTEYDSYSLANNLIPVNKKSSYKNIFPKELVNTNIINSAKQTINSEDERSDESEESEEKSPSKIVIDANLIGKKGASLKSLSTSRQFDGLKNMNGNLSKVSQSKPTLKLKVETKQLKLNLVDNNMNSNNNSIYAMNSVNTIKTHNDKHTNQTNQTKVNQQGQGSKNNSNKNQESSQDPHNVKPDFMRTPYEFIPDSTKTGLTEEMISNSEIRINKYSALFKFINDNVKEAMDLLSSAQNISQTQSAINKSEVHHSKNKNSRISKKSKRKGREEIEEDKKSPDKRNKEKNKSQSIEKTQQVEDVSNPIGSYLEEEEEEPEQIAENSNLSELKSSKQKGKIKKNNKEESEIQLLNISKDLALLDKKKGNEKDGSSIGLSKMNSYFNNQNLTGSNNMLNEDDNINDSINMLGLNKEFNQENQEIKEPHHRYKKSSLNDNMSKPSEGDVTEKIQINKIPLTKGGTELKYQKNIFPENIEFNELSLERLREEESYIDKLNKISESILESINNGSIALTDYNLDKEALNGFIDESINVLGNISNDISSINPLEQNNYPAYPYNAKLRKVSQKNLDEESKFFSRHQSGNMSFLVNKPSIPPKPTTTNTETNSKPGTAYRKKTPNQIGSNKSIKNLSSNTSNNYNVHTNNVSNNINNINVIKSSEYNFNNIEKKQTTNNLAIVGNQLDNVRKDSNITNNDLDATIENIPSINKTHAKKYSMVLNNLDKIKQMTKQSSNKIDSGVNIPSRHKEEESKENKEKISNAGPVKLQQHRRLEPLQNENVNYINKQLTKEKTKEDNESYEEEEVEEDESEGDKTRENINIKGVRSGRKEEVNLNNQEKSGKVNLNKKNVFINYKVRAKVGEARSIKTNTTIQKENTTQSK
eukprot:CAMPEP_0170526350 /NCGR_PEP_ID=MMETSP0209-20121228/11790_1 /TAXON_ID=665100 ORGANISM="Litonotus pictus, Strain P1" /NCGR_SAMPLE_ID=MMETSP0209 /ASSEMBLY_ACC=CAM_ASM_000301 /LENGTH=1196 /DNA_ID=CAMNT_0010816127 /DNA_START=1147 /DNA_END=4734 /DNA_ORIENTATION=-